MITENITYEFKDGTSVFVTHTLTGRERTEKRIEFVERYRDLFDAMDKNATHKTPIGIRIVSAARSALKYSCKTASCDIFCSLRKTYRQLTK